MRRTGARTTATVVAIIGLVGAMVAAVPLLESPAAAVTVPSAVSEFQPTLPDRWGGRTVAVTISPADDNVAIAASESGGLFRTTDDGANWTHLDGLVPHRMSDVRYAPNNQSLVLATTWATGDTQNPGGIWRSTNGGTTWQRPATLAGICGGNFNAWGIGFEPSSSRVFAGTDCGLAFSTDQGATWNLQNASRIHAVVALAGGVIHACADDGYRRYTIAGNTVTLAAGPVIFPAVGPGDVASGCPSRILEVSPHSLDVSPLEPTVLFAFTDGRSSTACNGTAANPVGIRVLLESRDNGANWQQIGGGCAARNPWVRTAPVNGDPNSLQIFYSPGLDLFRGTCDNSSVPRCGSLPAVAAPNVPQEHVDLMDFAFDSTNCGRYLASDGGLQASNDCGASFQMVAGSGANGGYNALQLYEIGGQVHPGGHTDLYIGTQDNDVWASGDGGATWPNQVCCEGWTFQTPYSAANHTGQQVTYGTCGPCQNRISGEHLTNTAAFPNAGAFAGADTGAPYLLQGTTTSYVQWAAPTAPDTLTRLFRTTDAGANWTAVNGATTNQAITGRAAVAGPAGDPTMYQAFCTSCGFATNTTGTVNPASLFKITGLQSANATVTTVAGGLQSLGTWNMGNAGFLVQEPTLGVDRNNPNHLIAADVGSNTMKQSRDGGLSWTTDAQLTSMVTRNGRLAFGAIAGAGTQARAMAFDPVNSDRILVGTESAGIISSLDNGQSWFRLSGSEKVTALSSFFFDSVNNEIFVTSFGRGLWKIELPEADLSVTKTHRPDPAIAGDQLYYDITVTNDGPDAVSGAVVTDTLDPKVTYVTSTLTSGGADACSAGAPPPGAGQTVICQLGALAPGGSVTFTIKVAVAADAVAVAGSPTQIVNTVSVQGAAVDPDESDNTYTDVAIVEDRADLEVTKLCKPDTTVRAGEPITCTVFVDNHGPSYARAVVVDDEMLSNGTFTVSDISPALGPGTPGCTLSGVTGGQRLTCRLGDLASATTSSPGRAKVTYTITATEGQDLNNVATVRSDTPDPVAANNKVVVSLTIQSVADLALTKSGPATAVAGGPDIAYQLTVTNNGPSTAGNVVVTDNVPAGVTVVSVSAPGGTCNAGVPGDPFQPTRCNLGTMAPGAIRGMTVTVRIDPATLGLIHNDARVSSDTFDDDIDDNLATVATEVTASADLAIAKTGSPDPVVAGSQLTYTVTVTNSGPSTAKDVRVTDTLPAGTTFVSGVDGNGATVCALVQPGIVVCELGTMAPGTAKTVYLTVLVAASVPTGTVLENQAAVTSSTPDPNGANNSVTLLTGVTTSAELWLDKTGELRSGNPAPVLTYTLWVRNDKGCEADLQSSPTPTCGEGGPSDARNITVTDALPLDAKKMAVQFVSPQCTYDKATHTVTCTSANVPAGAKVGFVIEAQVSGSVGTITNTATLTSDTPDPVSDNNVDSVDVVIKGGTGKRK